MEPYTYQAPIKWTPWPFQTEGNENAEDYVPFPPPQQRR